MQKMQEDPKGLTQQGPQVGSFLLETQLVPLEGKKNHTHSISRLSHELPPYIQRLFRRPGLEGIPVTILPSPLESKRETDSQEVSGLRSTVFIRSQALGLPTSVFSPFSFIVLHSNYVVSPTY